MDKVLVSPGPVHVPASLLERLPPLHHRSAEFRGVVRETESMLRELLGTDSPVCLLTSSGTGAMEAAVANVAEEGSRLLVVSGGKFGDRWEELCRVFGCETECLRFPDGGAIDVDAIRARVERSRPAFIALTHVESSTGLLFPLREIMAALPAERPIVVLDAISSLGVEDLDMDAWGIDVVVGACQKAFAAPPGVSFVSMGARARDMSRKRRTGLYYFDLKRWEAGRPSGDLPFTPAVQTIQILHGSLSKMRALGFDAVRGRHREASAAFLEAARHLSLHSLSANPSSAVQVLVFPKGCDGGEVLDALARSGFIAAGGQGVLSGAVIRTGFLGIFGARAIRELIHALGEAMDRCGVDTDRASAERAIRRIADRADLF